MRKNTRKAAAKTIPGPAMIHLRPGREAIDEAAYPDMDASGAISLRLTVPKSRSCTNWAAGICRSTMSASPISATRTLTEMLPPARRRSAQLLRLYARLINDVIADRPADLRVMTHICRGNAQSTWIAQGGYEPVAEVVFGTLNVDGFFLEYDSNRAGGFEPLRYMPEDKDVVLGLVSSKIPELESVADIKRRVDEASQYVPHEQAGPQSAMRLRQHVSREQGDRGRPVAKA